MSRQSWVGVCALLVLCAAAAEAEGQVPAPAPPKEEKKDEKPIIRFYALIKPTVIVSTDAVDSFGQPNGSAITAAGNPAMATLPNESRTTFQVAQSRLGVWFNEKEPFRGQIELDFFDVTKASPTVASLPRVRILKGEVAPTKELLIVAGQDWDLHAPINHHGNNMVGGAFQAGNTGFMRQQVKVIYTFSKLELGAAIGLQGSNNTAKDGPVELSRFPSFAGRVAFLAGDVGRIGVSGIFTQLRFTPGLPTERRATSGSGALFADLTPIAPLNLRLETYVGRNLANIGLLALGQGNADVNVDELGGFLSLKVKVAEQHALHAHFGVAQVLDTEDVVPSYAYAAPVAPATTPGPAALSGTGPGMTRNMTARLGYEFRPSKLMGVFLEGFFYQSTYVFQPVDVAKLDNPRRAFGPELGMIFNL